MTVPLSTEVDQARHQAPRNLKGPFIPRKPDGSELRSQEGIDDSNEDGSSRHRDGVLDGQHPNDVCYPKALTSAFIATNDKINVDFIKKDYKNIRHTRLHYSFDCFQFMCKMAVYRWSGRCKKLN